MSTQVAQEPPGAETDHGQQGGERGGVVRRVVADELDDEDQRGEQDAAA